VVKVVGLGAGGHAKVILDALRSSSSCELVGLLDPNPTLLNKKVGGATILGNDEMIPLLMKQGVEYFFIGVGVRDDTSARQRLFVHACGLGMKPYSIIHSSAIIAPSAVLGEGITIFAGAIINADAHIGNNVIINTGAIVEHDCIVGDHAHIATGARLSGTVKIGFGSHIGVGSSVKQNVSIGQNVTVGAGAVVVHDIPDNVVAVGVPARILRTKQGAT